MKPPGKIQIQCTKDVLHNLDTTKLHAPNFDCDIDGGSNCSAATDEDILSGTKPTSPTEH